ncbi:hypothetical protein BGW36DRAFT_302318 [Talaromyces proteolyticus]|uniref:Outer spore wall protein RRT8 n=1 Tax=Talaromyces proteolyticus TaxID=1131652 RepID=A0AAD4KN42_9EURO|nr:uncharacterized protein BGW36DRAFT_302318 [Talaromyces proteolyticus]KAH8692950.1 hypothetical protein BGW36DRAFT_302318 [Talaromyces proteolyticus]
MAERVKQAVKSEALRVGSLASSAAKSGAYIYPIKGIFYFLAHRSLWKPLLSRIGPTLSLGLSVTSAMFFFTYVPQLALLAITSGPLVAPISTLLLVLSESSTITNTLSRSFLTHEAAALVDTFDGTLISAGHEALVTNGRQLKASAADPIARLGRLIKTPFRGFSPTSLMQTIMYLPLNFVPVVGTLLFVVLQGRKFGLGVHERYFQLKGWKGSEREEWVQRHTPAYTSFGVLGFALEMVPVVSIFFSYTNTVGAALWAADIEAKASTTSGLREEGKKVE